MTVRGSVSKMIGRHIILVDKMSKECVETSLDTLAVLAAGFTPVGRTGRLKANWKRTPVSRNARGEYTGRIYNDLSYAAPVEYGSSPHIIMSKSRNGLLANREDGFGPVHGPVHHPGFVGSHMAQKAALAFQQSGSERAIAEEKVRKYLTH